MKIILLRDSGANLSLKLSRQRALVLGVLAVAIVGSLGYHAIPNFGFGDHVDAEVVAQWREQLNDQRNEVVEIERRTLAESAAVGRQLAQMQARLLRMEAIGARMTDDLEGEEFDFAEPPAQGGPLAGRQEALGWTELSGEIAMLADQLKRRETELNILDSVLASADLQQDAKVYGRPVGWGWLSSPYGNRVDPISGKTAWHAGVDFAGREDSEVIAVASGVVTFAGERSGYGKIVEISHPNGLVTRYAHHKSILVQTGDVVKKGDALATMGTTGRSTGPHVHFEVLKNGRHVDPAGYVATRS